jgi:hypothetical protein
LTAALSELEEYYTAGTIHDALVEITKSPPRPGEEAKTMADRLKELEGAIKALKELEGSLKKPEAPVTPP